MPNTLSGYRTWEQVAGYFDGDGNVGLEIIKRVIHLRLRFVDTWAPQIEAIKLFLNKQQVNTGKVGRDNKIDQWPVFRLEVSQVASVLRVAKAMLPHCVKKAEDLRIVIDYLEGRITGNEAVAAFNEEVKIGRRRGNLREANIPYTREEGLILSKRENAKRARAAYAVKVPLEVEDRIRGDHGKLGLGSYELSKKYGYSRSVIRRVLRA
jgi:hypothetical protein